MTIHHATAKKAAFLEISLIEVDHGGQTLAQATGRKPKVVFTHRDAKIALAAVIMSKLFRAEYPALDLGQDLSSDEFVVNGTDHEAEAYVELVRSTDFPVLADLLDAAEDAGVDPEAGYKEEQNVIVPERYKALYASRGDRNNCGDWLAQALAGLFVSSTPSGIETAEGHAKTVDQFDHEAFTEFLVLNGVDMTGKWAGLPTSGQKGWVGRYRMNGRQKLELVVTKRGTLILDAKHTVTPPMDFLEEMLEKHPNVDAEWLD